MGLLDTFADLEQDINHLSLRVVVVATIALVILLTLATLTHRKAYLAYKLPVFVMISFVVLASTITLFGSTVYINTRADSGGPVHWHADVEFWACGNELELRNPSGFLSNKIGTPSFHEHNDKRIHLEGVVVDREVDASLGKFMSVVGGEISKGDAVIPVDGSVFEDDTDGDRVDSNRRPEVERFVQTDLTGRKSVRLRDGRSCGGQKATLQTYVYRFNKANNTYRQTKISNPTNYAISAESLVPPGDCIIVEFGPVSSTTNKLCRQYGIRDTKRCTEFGVEVFVPKLCNIRQVGIGGED